MTPLATARLQYCAWLHFIPGAGSLFTSRMYVIAAIVFLGTLSAIAASQAAQPMFKTDAVEKAQLPKMCYAQYVDDKLASNPEYTFPPGCGAYMNHYCGGLILLYRASKASRPMGQRKEDLGMANDAFDYTLHYMPPTCPIRSDVEGAKARAGVVKKLLH